MSPHGINKHVNITKQQRKMLREKLKKKRKRMLRGTVRSQQRKSSMRTKTKYNNVASLSIVPYGGDTFRCNLTFKQRRMLLRVQQKREKAYKTSLIKREEYLEVNRWLDNMKQYNPLKVRTTYNAYNNIPLEIVLNDEESRVMGLDHINQQKQGEGQSSYGILGGI